SKSLNPCWQWGPVSVLRPQCDSPEAEEAALVAQDYLNGQHVHGYKYALNRIEDIKIITKPDGDNTYILEVDLLETNCHVLDPTPVANCTVRPKILTAVEGDCDVVLKKVGGALTVTAFKCKTEESTEDLCLGCPTLLPLNDTSALDFVHASLATFNNMTVDVTYTLLEVGRMSSQVGPRIIHPVQCTYANSTVAAAPALPPLVNVHTGSLSPKHGLRHHKLTTIHDPELSGLLSAESAESAEVVPVAPAVVDAAAAAAPTADPAAPVADPAADPAAADPAAADPAPAAADTAPADDSTSASDASSSKEVLHNLKKRDVPAAPAFAAANIPAIQTDPVPLVPVCPGRIRFF
uniref:Cystatin fetuin-A-type domain-containing protein n=1 Tax=Dicentrarchus labrax TaxID=13489 RepID=A0A8C4HHJ3_DICLA